MNNLIPWSLCRGYLCTWRLCWKAWLMSSGFRDSPWPAESSPPTSRFPHGLENLDWISDQPSLCERLPQHIDVMWPKRTLTWWNKKVLCLPIVQKSPRRSNGFPFNSLKCTQHASSLRVDIGIAIIGLILFVFPPKNIWDSRLKVEWAWVRTQRHVHQAPTPLFPSKPISGSRARFGINLGLVVLFSSWAFTASPTAAAKLLRSSDSSWDIAIQPQFPTTFVDALYLSIPCYLGHCPFNFSTPWRPGKIICISFFEGYSYEEKHQLI